MGKYIIEQEDEQYNISFIDEDIRDLVATTYTYIHAKIIVDTFNRVHARLLDAEIKEEDE